MKAARPPAQRRCLLPIRVLAGVAAAILIVFSSSTRAADLAGQWGGHLRTTGTVSWPSADSAYRLVNARPYTDGQSELRLTSRLFYGDHLALETHYEAVGLYGDTVAKAEELRRLFPGLDKTSLITERVISDDRRLMGLTRVLVDEDRLVAYHRLDRLNLTLSRPWGSLRIGRQALTWGNGMIFNPMDLFNPFSPTAVVRDYKVGDDMALLTRPMTDGGDIQLLYLPRRDTATSNVRADQSSFAGKWRLARPGFDLQLMAARHYAETVAGLGATGTIGDAAWRTDVTWTGDSDEHDGFIAAVANIDTAWQWGGKNVYGLFEAYTNGLGGRPYADTLADPAVARRLARGELFTLGRFYLAGRLQIEYHPLVNVSITAIVNTDDPSGVLQPQIIWDVVSDVQLLIGGAWYVGGADSEYGGFDINSAFGRIEMAPAPNAYAWLTWFF